MSTAAASACCAGVGACACRCRGPACRTATRGRSRAGDGIVLVDTGMHEPGSLEQLERAMTMVGLRLEDVRLLVCTHAHSDHYGQAGPIIDRAGCELWMHPNHAARDRLAAKTRSWRSQRRLEVARTSGVPERAAAPLRRDRARSRPPGIERVVEPDRALLPGIEVDTDLGLWTVIETPGHAPSHVCLLPARAPHPDLRRPPARPHLALLRLRLDARPGRRVPALARRGRGARPAPRLCLAGHARPFTDVQAHIEANRELVAQRVARDGRRDRAPAAHRLRRRAARARRDAVHAAAWRLTETLCYLRHLEAIGAARREPGDPERWVAV